ncbi:diguanylate cyclase/phosphodiesterase (GGDEF & EAL domains) with PAS/PAC sensor(s) [hydrothermal vent metagenome]|uniref:Diguanylate cyclase/phosphodiesterase (GGDEF & EAL domains) with PAS/PAC sensor(S) n=1 Tax=hydrothermal vent metagenome TaxID=652676 RepID=A0A3B0X5P6_9ZZZZ
MHSLLKQQLKELYGKSYDVGLLSENEQKLIELVSLSYKENDDALNIYERTIEVTSRDLNNKNRAINKAVSLLSEAQRLAKTGSWLFDLKNRTLEWSDELYRIFELDKKTVKPSKSRIIPLIHPEDKTLADVSLQKTHKEGSFDVTYRLKFESEQIKYVHEHREIILDKENNIVAIQGIIQDVTAQREAEENLHLYADVFHSSGESILITDKDNNIIATNTAFTESTGYTLADLHGKNPSVLSDEKTPRNVYENMWSELNAKGYWQGELNGRKKNGEVYPKWMSLSASYGEAGEVLNYIASFADISERKADQERIHYLAHHDALTGLINRFSLEERLSQAIHTAERNKTQLALIFIDMDRFKLINDTLGHAAGDDLLIEVANRLKQSVRESDIVARIGGDEFVIVLTEIKDSLSAAPIARSIIKKLGELYIINNQNVFSSPSMGISLFPSDACDANSLLKNADSAMYHAKDQGRNNYQFFTESLNTDANERLKLENDLRFAIENNQFVLFYQPQMCCVEKNYCGVEALIRWMHPQQGMIAPDKFIPIAEETRLIIPLGMWVLEEACRQLSEWKKQYKKSIKMAVNISAQQLQDSELVEKIKFLIDKYTIQNGELELEITESTAMRDPDEAILILRKIRDLGVELAIDDFGTGYSSLAYLKLLPINTLKLDRTFVSDLEFDNDDAEISAAALALAHNLGLSVVAEGVETEAQEKFLIEHKCETLQGFYFSKPLPASEVEKIIF